MEKKYNVLIIGSGPAGITASIYTIRANLSTFVVAGGMPGGQLMLTTDVEDFPGFPGGLQGPELMNRMRKQAEMFGVKFLDKDVTKIEKTKNGFIIFVGNEKYKAKAVIVATGSSASWLGIESEKKLIGRGVSACATCDGPLFKNKDVAVIGGGDTAVRETLFLSKFCKSVTLIHRKGNLRAQNILQDRVFKIKNVKFLWNTEAKEFIGEGRLESLKVINHKTKKISNLKLDGVFVAIGHTPNTKFLKGVVKLDSHGYIIVKDYVNTSLKGIFAAGDVHDYRYQQAVTAAGAGCMAAMEADEYINSLKHRK